jgi:hypothetical protein
MGLKRKLKRKACATAEASAAVKPFISFIPCEASSPIQARRFTLTGFSEDEKRTEKGGRS